MKTSIRHSMWTRCTNRQVPVSIVICLIVFIGIIVYNHYPSKEPRAGTYKIQSNFDRYEIYQEIDNHQIISFDIFDTLLLRPYVKPSDMFLHLELLANISGFSQYRVRADHLARKQSRSEVTLDEIYSFIPQAFQIMKRKELEFEQQIAYANEEMKLVFDYAVKKGKRLIIISDMYLPEFFLRDLLKSRGYAKVDRMYISSTYRKTKINGSLFLEVLKHERVDAHTILHIGDNRISDQYRASNYGLSTVLYPRRIDTLFANSQRAKLFYKKNSDRIGASILLGMIASMKLDGLYWYNLGVSYAGPEILGFMIWLKKILIHDKIEEVLFVARDGYSLEKVFNLIQQDSHILTHYVYAPRLTAIVINFDYKYLHASGAQVILRYFLSKGRLSPEQISALHSREDEIQFIEQHKELMENLVQEEKKEYFDYLRQFNISHQRLAVVDTGTQFLSAQRALMNTLPNRISGYYWAVGTGINQTAYSVQTFKGSSSSWFTNWGLMELLMTAPHPPVHQLSQGKILFHTNPNEDIRQVIYPSICAGILSFAKFYRLLFRGLDIYFTNDILVDWMNIFNDNPEQLDLEHFKDLKQTSDPEHSTGYRQMMRSWYDKKS